MNTLFLAAVIIVCTVWIVYAINHYAVMTRLYKFDTAEKRFNSLQLIYKELEREWSEQNVPTNLSVHFEEILKSIPKNQLELVGAESIKNIFNDEVEIAVNNRKRSEVEKW